jgi:dCTP deaminase
VAFWSGEKIQNVAGQNPNLISSFDPTRIDCNAYALRMGGEYYVTADHFSEDHEFNSKKLLSAGEPFLIPPGQFAFLLTKETVEIPPNAMAFISMKATYKFRGLINVSGFHVDPGYQGALVFSVYNAGSLPVHLEEGISLFLIWFADLDRLSKEKYVRMKDGAKSISSNLLTGMSGKILSLQSLSDEIAALKADMVVQRRLFQWGVGLATAVMASLLVGSILFFVEQDLLSNRAARSPTQLGSAITTTSPNSSQSALPSRGKKAAKPPGKQTPQKTGNP